MQTFAKGAMFDTQMECFRNSDKGINLNNPPVGPALTNITYKKVEQCGGGKGIGKKRTKEPYETSRTPIEAGAIDVTAGKTHAGSF
jgi:hypothetical protein